MGGKGLQQEEGEEEGNEKKKLFLPLSCPKAAIPLLPSPWKEEEEEDTYHSGSTRPHSHILLSAALCAKKCL